MDQPIPMLGNQTPMEAVKNPDRREIVESIVIQAERDGPRLQTDDIVFRRLRERLGPCWKAIDDRRDEFVTRVRL